MEKSFLQSSLADVQSTRPALPITVRNVGVSKVRARIRVPSRGGESQAVVARVCLGVELGPDMRGTHMSRLMEALENEKTLDLHGLESLLYDLRTRLQSPSATALFEFPFFMRKTTPSGTSSSMAYDCGLRGCAREGRLAFEQLLTVPVMTVCPCSLAISETGAHSQRAHVLIRARTSEYIFFEDLIELAEKSASAQVYPLLKRQDEKLVTEQAFASPAFVEDVARKCAFLLRACPKISCYDVKVESMESIHDHDAFAQISEGYGPDCPPDQSCALFS